MSKIDKSLRELNSLNAMALEDNWLNRIHPLVKLFLTLLYISITVSFNRYDVFGLLSMASLMFLFFASGILSFSQSIYRIRFVLPFVIFIGIFNPILEREVVLVWNNIKITAGEISFFTLIIKGLLTVLSSYILIASTPVEKICFALRQLHFPEIIVTQILLVYRYVYVLMTEVKKIMNAYSLRAPGQKGVHFKAWGSLAGNLLLRSMDRAQIVWESMCLRGFENSVCGARKIKFRVWDFLILILCGTVFVCFRIFPVFTLLGGLFV